jgi:hypothetical protein
MYGTIVELDRYEQYGGNVQNFVSDWLSPCPDRLPHSCNFCKAETCVQTEFVIRPPRILIIQNPGVQISTSSSVSHRSFHQDGWRAPLTLAIPCSSSQYHRAGLILQTQDHFTAIARPPKSPYLLHYDDMLASGRVRVEKVENEHDMDLKFGENGPIAFASIYVLLDGEDESGSISTTVNNRFKMFCHQVDVQHSSVLGDSQPNWPWLHMTPTNPLYLAILDTHRDDLGLAPSTGRRIQSDFVIMNPAQEDAAIDTAIPCPNADHPVEQPGSAVRFALPEVEHVHLASPVAIMKPTTRSNREPAPPKPPSARTLRQNGRFACFCGLQGGTVGELQATKKLARQHLVQCPSCKVWLHLTCCRREGIELSSTTWHCQACRKSAEMSMQVVMAAAKDSPPSESHVMGGVIGDPELPIASGPDLEMKKQDLYEIQSIRKAADIQWATDLLKEAANHPICEYRCISFILNWQKINIGPSSITVIMPILLQANRALGSSNAKQACPNSSPGSGKSARSSIRHVHNTHNPSAPSILRYPPKT